MTPELAPSLSTTSTMTTSSSLDEAVLEEGHRNDLSEILTYATPQEALRVAKKVAQSKDHRTFVTRMESWGWAMSEPAQQVLARIKACGRGRVRSTRNGRYRVERERCGYPTCPTCGLKSRDRAVRDLYHQINDAKFQYGNESVSFVTINANVCSLSEVGDRVSQLRVALRNAIARKCANVTMMGEVELIHEVQITVAPIQVVQEINEGLDTDLATGPLEQGESGKGGEGLMTTHPGLSHLLVKPHLHLIAVHPGLKRRSLSKALGSIFKGSAAVRVESIRDRIGAGGRWVNGPQRVAKYLSDKSAGVKGAARIGAVLAQAVAFDGYARLSGGTRRRPRVRVGRLTSPSTNRSPLRETTLCPKADRRDVLSMMARMKALAERSKAAHHQ